MIGTHRIGAVAKQGARFFLTRGTALKAWYRMDRGASVSSAGSLVALADLSGSGDANKNLLATGGTVTYNAIDVAYGNRPTASFNAAPRLESIGAWTTPLPQPFTIYAVGEISADNGRIVDGAASNRAILMRTASNFAMYAGSSFVTGSGTTPQSPTVIAGVFNGASSALYVSNSQVANASGNPGTDILIRATLGDLVGGGGPLLGKIAEVAIVAGPDDAVQRRQAFLYLGGLYRLAVS